MYPTTRAKNFFNHFGYKMVRVFTLLCLRPYISSGQLSVLTSCRETFLGMFKLIIYLFEYKQYLSFFCLFVCLLLSFFLFFLSDIPDIILFYGHPLATIYLCCIVFFNFLMTIRKLYCLYGYRPQQPLICALSDSHHLNIAPGNASPLLEINLVGSFIAGTTMGFTTSVLPESPTASRGSFIKHRCTRRSSMYPT